MRWLVLLLLAPTARADEHAFSVNPPLRWADGGALAASGYVGVAESHALRANVSRYDYGPNAAGELMAMLLDGASSEATYGGTITDVGIGWMLFPRGLYDGFSVELGVLLRRRDTEVTDPYARDFEVQTESTTFGARALVGWSWRFRGLFASMQVGIAGGYEHGRERVQEGEFDKMTVERDVARGDITAEGFVRIGAVFQ